MVSRKGRKGIAKGASRKDGFPQRALPAKIVSRKGREGLAKGAKGASRKGRKGLAKGAKGGVLLCGLGETFAHLCGKF